MHILSSLCEFVIEYARFYFVLYVYIYILLTYLEN